jgi:hypothetical protein
VFRALNLQPVDSLFINNRRAWLLAAEGSKFATEESRTQLAGPEMAFR